MRYACRAYYLQALLPLVATITTIAMAAWIYPRGRGGGSDTLLRVREYLELSAERPVPIGTSGAALAYAQREVWNATNLVLLVVAVGVLAVAVWFLIANLRQSMLPPERRYDLLALAATFFGITLCLKWLVPHTPQLTKILERLTQNPFLGSFSATAEAFAFAVAAMLAWVASSLLVPTDDPADPVQIAARLRRLRVVLYVGALLLITEMAQASALSEWATKSAFPFGKPEAPKYEVERFHAVQALASSFVMLRAIFSTLLLSAIYLPAATVLSMRARQLVRAVPAEDAENWLKKHGLTSTVTETLPRLAAVLAPLLAAPAKELFGLLGK